MNPLDSPLAKLIIAAYDELTSSLCYGKTYDPRELARQQHARERLDQLRVNAPVTYGAVMRQLQGNQR